MCSVKSYLFVECRPGMYSCAMSGKLLVASNVGATFEATSYYQKIDRSKIKIAEKGCCSENNTLSFFLQSILWTLLDITLETCAILSQEN